MATVGVRGDSWWVRWRLGGARKGRGQSTTWPTRDLALAAAELARTRNHDVTANEVYRAVYGLDANAGPETPLLADWCRTWLDARAKVGDVQPDTLARYRQQVARWVVPQLGRMRLGHISPDTVTAWVTWLVAQPSARGGTLSPSTVRKGHALLHSVLAAAVPRWLAANPAARPPGSRGRTAGLPKRVRYEALFLTAAEVDLIAAACGPHIADMAYVAVRTGLRLGELLVLRVGEDAVFTGRRRAVKVRRALKADGSIGPPKSARSRRDVSISTGVAERLAARADGRRRGALYFPAPRGGLWSPSNLRRRHWLPALAEAQRCAVHPPAPPVKGATGPARLLRPDEVSTCDCPGRLHQVPRWHDLRHTHVSLCVEAGWDPVRVQRRVGHESITTTMDLYGHLWEGDGDDRLDAVERLLLLADDEDA